MERLKAAGRPWMSTTQDASGDAELRRQVADGSGEALGQLHRRFARSVFRIAAQSLDRAAAEDLVQDVLLAVWRQAARRDHAPRQTRHAAARGLPLGPGKPRSRAGRQTLRTPLAPQWAALVALCLLAAL